MGTRQRKTKQTGSQDTDARWTKKGGQNHYGYKNHINIDKDTKLITGQACTDASVHASQVLDTVLRDANMGGKDTRCSGCWTAST